MYACVITCVSKSLNGAANENVSALAVSLFETIVLDKLWIADTSTATPVPLNSTSHLSGKTCMTRRAMLVDLESNLQASTPLLAHSRLLSAAAVIAERSPLKSIPYHRIYPPSVASNRNLYSNNSQKRVYRDREQRRFYVIGRRRLGIRV